MYVCMNIHKITIFFVHSLRCMYAHRYIYIYIYICVCVCVRTHICTLVCIVYLILNINKLVVIAVEIAHDLGILTAAILVDNGTAPKQCTR